jgi:hypothetical protein
MVNGPYHLQIAVIKAGVTANYHEEDAVAVFRKKGTGERSIRRSPGTIDSLNALRDDRLNQK